MGHLATRWDSKKSLETIISALGLETEREWIEVRLQGDKALLSK